MGAAADGDDVVDGDGVVDELVDSRDVPAGSSDVLPGDSPEACVVAAPAVEDSADVDVAGPVADGSANVEGVEDDVTADEPPGASPEPVVET